MSKKNLLTIAEHVQKRLSETLHMDREYSDEEFNEAIEECVVKEMSNTYLNISEREKITEYVFNSTRRFDFLQPLLEDDEITEIMINGAENIFVEKNGRIEKLQIEKITEEKLYEIVQNMVSKVNRIVNESSPIVDLALPDGSRANIVLKPLAVNGPCITIRKFPKDRLTMEKLVSNETVSVELAELLKDLVINKNNILVSGGTSSGKTTLLNVLSENISKNERVITIEDSTELQISETENLVSLEVRNKNFEGGKEIDIRELVKTSLRMRPDRIIVGEVRDKAALDMIQALNTGHSGSMSTIHSNSAEDALLRLETMMLTAEVMPLEAIRRQIAAAINIVIHLERDSDLKRRVKKIIEICGVENGTIMTKELY